MSKIKKLHGGVLPGVIFFILLHLTATTTTWLGPLGSLYKSTWYPLVGPSSPILPLIIFGIVLSAWGEDQSKWRYALLPYLPLALGSLGWGGAMGDWTVDKLTYILGAGGVETIHWGAIIAINWTFFGGFWRTLFSATNERESESRPPTQTKRRRKRQTVPPTLPESQDSPPKKRRKRVKKKVASSPESPTSPETPPYAIPLELLTKAEKAPSEPKRELSAIADAIVNTLADIAQIEPVWLNTDVGRTVIRVELEVPHSTNLGKVRGAAENIALAVSSPGKVRVIAPVVGKGTIAIEIPRKKKSTLRLREVLESEALSHDDHPLAFVMGTQVSGGLLVENLAEMPHLLIAGATQSGKSVFANTFLLNLIYRNSPDQLRLILMDMKKVELTLYKDIPHLLVPIITSTEHALNALDWACRETDRRYDLLGDLGVKNLKEYNRRAEDPLPYIVVVIEELSALLNQSKGRVQEYLSDLSERSRAAGIHLVATMQRPDSKKLDGSIKANLPGKISFRLGTRADSITIFGTKGAEDLLGRGDLYFDGPNHPELVRCQAPLVETKEIDGVLDYLRDTFGMAKYDESLSTVVKSGGGGGGGMREGIPKKDQDFLDQIRGEIGEMDKLSISGLQRQFGIGYNKAARLMMFMEKLGWVSQDPDSKAGQKGFVVHL